MLTDFIVSDDSKNGSAFDVFGSFEFELIEMAYLMIRLYNLIF